MEGETPHKSLQLSSSSELLLLEGEIYGGRDFVEGEIS